MSAELLCFHARPAVDLSASCLVRPRAPPHDYSSASRTVSRRSGSHVSEAFDERPPRQSPSTSAKSQSRLLQQRRPRVQHGSISASAGGVPHDASRPFRRDRLKRLLRGVHRAPRSCHRVRGVQRGRRRAQDDKADRRTRLTSVIGAIPSASSRRASRRRRARSPNPRRDRRASLMNLRFFYLCRGPPARARRTSDRRWSRTGRS